MILKDKNTESRGKSAFSGATAAYVMFHVRSSAEAWVIVMPVVMVVVGADQIAL